MLKILVECKNVKIFFDFKHDSVFYLDPKKRFSTKGTAYTSGKIYIGSKHVTDNEKKFEVFGALAHELCHLAVLITFMNFNFDPFQTGESDQKRRYIDKVMKECKEQQKFEEIVENVFEYAVNLQEFEMTVTVPQILMHYYKNEEKIEELKEIFQELFKYCEEVVEPEFEKVLPLLKILEDEKKVISFQDLSKPMKAKLCIL
ncbi:unnamed protein product [Chironomus riparius]|uniref:Uncharacterized protein n=1 Tax=Chironomus riparius TaxID=315576 RepID=A0A9N9WNB5_9DIPT|nr:unnamed protein product [Chironomus riparius]